ncbi:hypothetical protein [Nocardiopsis ansamitocini]|uniref:Uncharacterized protein n=1 Tax=Nocardiopsis ansamitocini TaxID=1670832 RepID=A0A9W6P8V9_9ACTN|nr:hypothetical protein [Nocardiopsis ansamitocini]GLU49123.1 hypothetical protein Nans01_34740 [Nocardiopsis ansamitocini]
MSDPYRIDNTPDAPRRGRRREAVRDGSLRRGLLWTVLIVSATANAVTSLSGFPTLVSLSFGLITVLCIVLLVVGHLRRR